MFIVIAFYRRKSDRKRRAIQSCRQSTCPNGGLMATFFSTELVKPATKSVEPVVLIMAFLSGLIILKYH